MFRSSSSPFVGFVSVTSFPRWAAGGRVRVCVCVSISTTSMHGQNVKVKMKSWPYGRTRKYLWNVADKVHTRRMLLKLPTIIFQFQIVSPICYCLTFHFAFFTFVQFLWRVNVSLSMSKTGTRAQQKNGFKKAAVTEISVRNSSICRNSGYTYPTLLKTRTGKYNGTKCF